MKYLLWGGLLLLSLSACQEETPDQLLERARTQLDEHSSLAYDVEQIWDNRFLNAFDTVISSTVFIKNEDSPLDYDLVLLDDRAAAILKGNQFWDILHESRQIVTFSEEESAEYFSEPEYFSPYARSPVFLLAQEGWTYLTDSLLQDQEVAIFEIREDDTLPDGRLRTEVQQLLIHAEKGQLLMHSSENIIEGELAQGISTHFLDYEIDTVALPFEFDFPTGYSEVTMAEYEQAQDAEAIEAGMPAPNIVATDTEGRPFDLAEHRGKRVLLNFSFAGCRGCEAAMQQLSSDEFQWPEDMVPVYVNHENSKAEIETYYADKSLPFSIILPEATSVREEYGVYLFPTFYVLNEEGVVDKIMSGYDPDFINNL